MRKAGSNRSLNTALWTALVLTLGVGISACSSEKEVADTESGKIMAVDRVDEAADIARQNGPTAEDMDFPETAPVAMTDADATTATEEATATAAADMPDATAAVETDMPATNADMPSDNTTDVEPVTN